MFESHIVIIKKSSIITIRPKCKAKILKININYESENTTINIIIIYLERKFEIELN